MMIKIVNVYNNIFKCKNNNVIHGFFTRFYM